MRKITAKIMLNNHKYSQVLRNQNQIQAHKNKEQSLPKYKLCLCNGHEFSECWTETTFSVTSNSKHHGNSSTSNRQGRDQRYARHTGNREITSGDQSINKRITAGEIIKIVMARNLNDTDHQTSTETVKQPLLDVEYKCIRCS